MRYLWMTALVLWGCSDGSDPVHLADEEAASSREDSLYYKADRLWASSTIDVCFEQSNPTEDNWVRRSVESTFESISDLDFVGWDVCNGRKAQVVIRVGNNEWPRAKVGTRSASTSPRVWFNYFSGNAADVDGDGTNDFDGCWSATASGQAQYVGVTGRTWDSGQRSCIEATAIHEFAHVLGMVHEQERPDTPTSCTADGARAGGSTEYGYYDVTSISNYCNPAWNGDGYLSPLDVAGLMSVMYGVRTDDHVWYGIGDVANYGGLSTHQAMFDIRAQDVGGNYHPFVGDFDGDGRDDMFWYGYKEESGDYIWFGQADRDFDDSVGVMQVRWGYRPGVSDLDGDGRADIFWHDRETGVNRIWWGRTDRNFDRNSVTVPSPTSTDIPIGGDFDGDGYGDLFLYSTSGPDRILWGSNKRTGLTFTATTNVTGSYTPLVGDFDADGRSDIFWYGRGDTADSIWWGRANRGFDKTNTDVRGVYYPTVSDVDGNGASDIIWSNESGDDTIWLFDARSRGNSWSTPTKQMWNNTPYGGDFDGDGLGDVFWYF